MSSLAWLRQFATEVIQTNPIVDSPEILMHQLISLLKSPNMDESSLIDLVGMDLIYNIPELLDRKSSILLEWAAAAAQSANPTAQPISYMGETLSQIRFQRGSDILRSKQVRKMERRKNVSAPVISGFDEEIELLSQLGWDGESEPAQPAPRGTQGVGGPKLTLPEGTTRHTFETFEEYRIPAAVNDNSLSSSDTPLVAVDSLPSYCQAVFSSDSAYLNRIQSTIFPTAFNTNENFLACAPTGAGKTNVSLLAICRLIREWKSMPNPPLAPKFKVVYLAPMKALVAEIVEKFTSKLKHLGVCVREFTGDISIPRKEFEFTNIIVTVPEKWDILMRNLGKVSAAIVPGEQESSLLAQIKLMIIDEVHLLNDDRGAVIESIVARTMQFCESNYSPIRFVALSATFPNYEDIGQFLTVARSNMFYFDNSFRPVPLEQTIVGVGRPAPPSTSAVPAPVSRNVTEAINKVTADKVLDILREGQQVMVFVHSRNDTVKTAEALIDLITTKIGPSESVLLGPKISSPHHSSLVQSVVSKGHSSKVRNVMNNLIQSGITVHHAGMLRPERTLAEKLFKEGIASVLVCTATLAWGVNLPSRYVIIKGTNIWDSAAGGFRDIDLLDILQIFGRAGRPQFDTIGKATLITSRDRLDYFIRLVTSQIPIESRFSTHLPDALNAEISLGNITCLDEAVNWLKYTYMFVRFFKAPQKYGIGVSDISRDPQLLDFRTALIKSAAETLNTARMIRIVSRQTSSYASTDLGRVAAHFYVRYDTAEMFATRLSAEMTDSEIIELIGNANEFSQLKCREDEMQELESVAIDKTICPISKIRGGGLSSVPGKVSVLLQVYVSRNYFFQSSSLSSDMNYVAQNIVRLFRCLFEVSLTRTVGVSGLAQRLLEWSKIVERRIWHSDIHHFLRHYTIAPSWFHTSPAGGAGGPKLLKEWVVNVLEDRKFDLDRIFDYGLSRAEISNLVKGSPDAAKSLNLFLSRIPRIEISCRAVPIAAEILQLELSLQLVNKEWSDAWSGLSEPFHIFIADTEHEDIYSHSHFVVHKKDRNEKIEIKTIIPLTEPKPNQLTVSVVSDRYVGLEFFDTITIPKTHGLVTSVVQSTTLLDLYPLPKSALDNSNFEKIFSFSHFNPIQTQLFHQVYHSDENILCGCPTGSGKTVIADLAILRIFQAEEKNKKTIYIAPQKALSRERIVDWQNRFGKLLGKSVVELTGDYTPDLDALIRSDIIVTTPEKWDGISRNWKQREYVGKVGLVILDEIHLLGQERGAILEVIVSRMRMVASQVRFVGLSTALANSVEIANWLNVDPIRGLFNFKPSVRPVPMTVHVQGFPGAHYCPRMATMNKPCVQAIHDYSPEKPVIVFVSSRRQTRLTAFDIISYANQNITSRWLRLDPVSDPLIEDIVDQIENEALKHTIAFGVGIHHAGLRQSDRELVEKLFQTQKIQVLVATSTLSVGVNMPAHLVIVKGTEYFDPRKKKYVDMPVTDVLQMMGRAGRPQFDTTATSVVMVHEPKKNFYRKFLYSPFPLESSLHLQLTDHLNAEISNGAIRNLSDAIDFIAWTYLFRRLTVNPDYYISDTSAPESDDTDRIGRYVKQLIMDSAEKLEKSSCILIKRGSVSIGQDGVQFIPTRIGQIASMYYLRHSTVAHLYTKLVCGRREISMMELAKILADSDEYEEFPMRHKDDEYNEKLASKFPFKIEGNFESPHMKAFLVQFMHMFHVEPPIQDYFTDLKSFLDQSVRIIQGMIEVLMTQRQGCLKTILNLLLLNQCLAMGTHPYADLIEFMVSKKHVKQVGEYQDLCELIETADTRGLPKDVVKLVKGMPCAKWMTEFDREKDCLRIKIEHKNKPDENAVVPLSMADSKASSGKRRKVAWWVVAGDSLNGSVIGIRRINVNDRPKTISIKLDEYRSPAVTLYLISDCYLGIDQEMSLEVI